jgi:hypothetical protein
MDFSFFLFFFLRVIKGKLLVSVFTYFFSCFCFFWAFTSFNTLKMTT